MIALARALFLVLLLAPMLLLVALGEVPQAPDWERVFHALMFTLSQSVVTATATLLLASVAATGIVGWQGWSRKFLWLVLFAPQMLPGISVVVSLLGLFPSYPLGWAGVVIAHVLMNVGWAGMTLAWCLERDIDAQTRDQCRVLGASRLQFWWMVYRGEMRWNWRRIWGLVFFHAFMSFVVPLTLGGLETRSLEILVYESLRQNVAWGRAITLVGLQSLSLALICVWVNRDLARTWFVRKSRAELNGWSFWRWPIAVTVGVVPGVLLFAGLMVDLPGALRALDTLEPLQSSLWRASLGSFLIATTVGFATVFTVRLTVFLYPDESLRKFLLVYVSPGAVITGFVLLAFQTGEPLIEGIKVVLGMTLVFFPWLYRGTVDGAWSRLQSQVDVALTLGASRVALYRDVTWPQMRGAAAAAGAIAAFWAAGEYALSSLLLGGEATLVGVVDRLIGSYRIDLAVIAVLLMVGVGSAAGALVWVGVHGSRR